MLRTLALVIPMLDHVAPASVDIHVVYDVIADPPVNSGRVHDRYAVVPDENPLKKRGSDETVAATGVDSTTDEATLVPTALIAKTRN